MVRAKGLYLVPAALLFAARLTASEHPASPSVAVFLDFDHAPAAGLIADMRAEVDRILAPSGLRFEWHSLHDDQQANSTFADLAVARFKGVCTSHPDLIAGHLPSQPTVLATTAVSDGHVLPFTEVECNTLGRFLGNAITALPARERNRAFARAMGRVLAHELYHVFGETRKHGSSGVASAFHSRRDLLAPEFNFSSAESEMFRDFQSRIAVPISNESSALAEARASASGN